MTYRLVYRDYPEGPAYVFSRHRTLEAAERAKGQAEADPWWGGYFFDIEELL